ncbi:MAG: DUF6279 family lipoprotein [Candidatus Thiodiazotropha sp.]
MQFIPLRIDNKSRQGQLLRTFLTVLLVLLLSACSRIQLAYNNLDWLLPHYLGSYMPLTDNQDSLLEAGVDDFLQWHCSTQVTSYAQLLREVDRRFRSNDLKRIELAAFNDRVQQAWATILKQGSPSLGVILLTADEAQIKELFEGFEERNSEWLVEFEATSDEELRDDYRDRMSKELERWFGELDEQQEQILVVWSRQFRPLGLQGLEVRRRWQSRLQRSTWSIGLSNSSVMHKSNTWHARSKLWLVILTNSHVAVYPWLLKNKWAPEAAPFIFEKRPGFTHSQKPVIIENPTYRKQTCGILVGCYPLLTSVVSYIKRAFRKPLKPRVQGAARREWLFPFQGRQRRNRGLSGLPQGEARDLSSIS